MDFFEDERIQSLIKIIEIFLLLVIIGLILFDKFFKKEPVTVTDTVNDSNCTSNNLLKDESLGKELKSISRKKYEDTAEFTAFWDAYPKHQGKATARTAFEKVDVPLQVLLDAIEEQKKSRQWTKDGGDFIPMPTTWLNQRRWEDSMDVNMQGKDRYANLRKLAEEFDDE